MQDDPRFLFYDAEQYAFLYENAHLLLVSWKRDDTKFLFLIRGEKEVGDIELGYPGATFTDTVLDAVIPIFFVQVQEEDGADPKHYILGSYFWVGKVRYGAYYHRDSIDGQGVVLFKILGVVPELQLEVPSEHEYQAASEAFAAQHGDFMRIQSI